MSVANPNDCEAPRDHFAVLQPQHSGGLAVMANARLSGFGVLIPAYE